MLITILCAIGLVGVSLECLGVTAACFGIAVMVLRFS
jgi:hypothetical protein